MQEIKIEKTEKNKKFHKSLALKWSPMGKTKWIGSLMLPMERNWIVFAGHERKVGNVLIILLDFPMHDSIEQRKIDCEIAGRFVVQSIQIIDIVSFWIRLDEWSLQ